MKLLHEEKIKMPRFLALLLSGLAIFSPIIKVLSDITTRFGSIEGTEKGISVNIVVSLPGDIDAFWEKASRDYDVMLVRNKEYLEWRYIENPDTYSIMLATNEEGATVGYLIAKTGFYGRAPVGYVVDYLTLENSPEIFKRLLQAALNEFQKKKVSFISTWAVKGGFYDKILFKFGFLPFSKIVPLCFQNDLGSRVISKNIKWHFTMGDSDAI